jgi:hypothetical protein
MVQYSYRLLLLIVIFVIFAEVANSQAVTERSAHFRVVHPRTVDARDAKYILNLLEHNRAELLERLSKASLNVRFPHLDLVFSATTGDFVARSGMPPWAAAATWKNRIELQPLTLLKQRQILETTLRHELAHAVIDTLGNTQTPRWLAEGLAVYLAGEGKLLERYRSDTATSAETVERSLTAPKSLAEMRTAYSNAYALVRDLIRTGGETKLWQRLASQLH